MVCWFVGTFGVLRFRKDDGFPKFCLFKKVFDIKTWYLGWNTWNGSYMKNMSNKCWNELCKAYHTLETSVYEIIYFCNYVRHGSILLVKLWETRRKIESWPITGAYQSCRTGYIVNAMLNLAYASAKTYEMAQEEIPPGSSVGVTSEAGENMVQITLLIYVLKKMHFWTKK